MLPDFPQPCMDEVHGSGHIKLEGGETNLALRNVMNGFIQIMTDDMIRNLQIMYCKRDFFMIELKDVHMYIYPYLHTQLNLLIT